MGSRARCEFVELNHSGPYRVTQPNTIQRSDLLTSNWFAKILDYSSLDYRWVPAFLGACGGRTARPSPSERVHRLLHLPPALAGRLDIFATALRLEVLARAGRARAAARAAAQSAARQHDPGRGVRSGGRGRAQPG